MLGSLGETFYLETSENLDEFLPIALIDSEQQVENLSRPSLRKFIISAAVERFLRDFIRLEEALTELPDAVFAKEWWPRTAQEVEILLK